VLDLLGGIIVNRGTPGIGVVAPRRHRRDPRWCSAGGLLMAESLALRRI